MCLNWWCFTAPPWATLKWYKKEATGRVPVSYRKHIYGARTLHPHTVPNCMVATAYLSRILGNQKMMATGGPLPITVATIQFGTVWYRRGCCSWGLTRVAQMVEAPGSLPKGLSEICGFEGPKMTISLSKIADLRSPEGEIFENTVRICGFETVLLGQLFFNQVHSSM